MSTCTLRPGPDTDNLLDSQDVYLITTGSMHSVSPIL